MKAAYFVEPRKPWPIREVPDPVPAPGQVLVRIRACGMCGAEVHIHDSIALIMRQVRIVGSTQNRRADLVDALALAAAGKVKPAVEPYPLARIDEARDRLEAGRMRYRAVLLP